MDEIWPRLYARMSCCERLRHVSGWAGLYEVSPIAARSSGRAAPRVYEAHSFSGRGVMQSYGAGQALADLIADGTLHRASTRSALSRERFERGDQARCSKSCTFEALAGRLQLSVSCCGA